MLSRGRRSPARNNRLAIAGVQVGGARKEGILLRRRKIAIGRIKQQIVAGTKDQIGLGGGIARSTGLRVGLGACVFCGYACNVIRLRQGIKSGGLVAAVAVAG